MMSNEIDQVRHSLGRMEFGRGTPISVGLRFVRFCVKIRIQASWYRKSHLSLAKTPSAFGINSIGETFPSWTDRICNFRVITVTPTKQRALNLCQKLQKKGLAFKRFWFTTIEHFSPEKPTAILEKIFFTPKDFEEGKLYDFRD